MNKKSLTKHSKVKWLTQDLHVGEETYLLDGVKKLGISEDYSYLIWNKEIITMRYVRSNKMIETIDYADIGPKFVEAVRYFFMADGRMVTVLKYNHHKKGFVVDHVLFSNIEFRDL